MYERAERKTGCTAGEPRPFLVGECGIGDIEVRPRRLLGKGLEEGRPSAGTGRPPAAIFDQRHFAANLLFVFWIERHRPEPFSGCGAGTQETFVQTRIRTPKASGR